MEAHNGMESVLSIPKHTSAEAVTLELCPWSPVHSFLISGSTSQRATAASQFPSRLDTVLRSDMNAFHSPMLMACSSSHSCASVVVPPASHLGSKSRCDWKMSDPRKCMCSILRLLSWLYDSGSSYRNTCKKDHFFWPLIFCKFLLPEQEAVSSYCWPPSVSSKLLSASRLTML